MIIHIGEAILSLNPLAIYNLTAPSGTDIDNATITWHDGTTPISKADIKAEMERLQSEYDAKDYQRKRKAEYPSVQDLVVALYDTDDKAAIDSKRAEIKLKYPKPQ
jgi:hypothetical protein